MMVRLEEGISDISLEVMIKEKQNIFLSFCGAKLFVVLRADYTEAVKN